MVLTIVEIFRLVHINLLGSSLATAVGSWALTEQLRSSSGRTKHAPTFAYNSSFGLVTWASCHLGG